MVAERRKSTRTRVNQPAKIIAPSGDAEHLCVVNNLTINGACVTMAVSMDVPSTFELTFDKGHTFWSCRVIWRNSQRGSVGVIWRRLS